MSPSMTMPTPCECGHWPATHFDAGGDAGGCAACPCAKFRPAKSLTHAETVPVPAWAVIAWVWDRREQYLPSSGTYEGLSQIIAGLGRGDHVEAFRCGELDDLKKDVERVMRKR